MVDGSFVKVYSRVVHALKWNTNLSWAAPSSLGGARKKLMSLLQLDLKLRQLPYDIGGVRIEVRYSGTLQSALSQCGSLLTVNGAVTALGWKRPQDGLRVITREDYHSMCSAAVHVVRSRRLYVGSARSGLKKAEQERFRELLNFFGWNFFSRGPQAWNRASKAWWLSSPQQVDAFADPLYKFIAADKERPCSAHVTDALLKEFCTTVRFRRAGRNKALWCCMKRNGATTKSASSKEDCAKRVLSLLSPAECKSLKNHFIMADEAPKKKTKV